MARAFDEPDALYGLVAESVETGVDGTSLIFHLREGARFHDGTPLTAEDAAFSFLLLKAQGHPLIAQNLKEMVAADAHDPLTLVLRFSGEQTRFSSRADCRFSPKPSIPGMIFLRHRS